MLLFGCGWNQSQKVLVWVVFEGHLQILTRMGGVGVWLLWQHWCLQAGQESTNIQGLLGSLKVLSSPCWSIVLPHRHPFRVPRRRGGFTPPTWAGAT